MRAQATPPARRLGVFILGALGDIATTLIVGGIALARGLTGRTGLVSELPPMDRLGLVPPEAMRFGGIDIRNGSPVDAAEAVYRNSRTFSREFLDSLSPTLARIARDVTVEPRFRWSLPRPAPGDPPLADTLERLRGLMRAFATAHELDAVVVVNLTSAEPLPPPSDCCESVEALERAIAEDRKDRVTPGMLSTYAAFREGHPYINFTPNAGPDLRALAALGHACGVPFYGNDGKTGETLVKTALAPLFAYRNLKVLSWEGTNLLGNHDGQVLEDGDNRAAKLRNKKDVLERLLGYPLHAGVSINYVPSLGDWKTAWDLIHFEGFLGVKMSMQFTWQGCDSVLAAPLVLDMIRLSEFALRKGECGPMKQLASFFKQPIGVDEMALPAQFQMLVEYAHAHLMPRAGSSRSTSA